MSYQQYRTGLFVRAMLEKLKDIYFKENFEEDDEVTLTYGYVLNCAYLEVAHITDWSEVIKTSEAEIGVESEYYDLVKNKNRETQVMKFRLSEVCSKGIDELTAKLTNELMVKVQKGYSLKQILKAVLIFRNNNKNIKQEEL